MARQHVIAFFENQDGAGASTELAALVDTVTPGVFPLQDADTIRVDPTLRFVVGIHAHVDQTAAASAELQATSFRERYKRTRLAIPRLSATAEPASPPAINDLRSRPIELRGGDLLRCYTVNNPAAATDQFVVLNMADGPVAPVEPGPNAFWLPCTTTASAFTANAWNARQLATAEALLPGQYEVLGGRCQSTSAIAARLNLALGDNYHPPIAACDARSDITAPMFEPGQMGVLGRFNHDNLPVVEVLADAADNEIQYVDLLVRPVSGAR